ncbi:hypothetical protein [Amedibacterium intestinale]|uniref:hypothetical protein n=1 Tax=Amedibacterium intestinale TaxID=2583452 RepID=UPI0039939852
MKLTRYEIEMKVRDIVDEIAEENEVEKDFYGDCYPDEVMKLENMIELESNEEERNAMFDEIREILEGCI